MNSETDSAPTDHVPTLPPDRGPRPPLEHEPAVRPSAAGSVPRHTGGSSAVPPTVRAASEWSWRLLLIAAGIFVLTLAIREVSEIVVPILIALLLTALLGPLTARLRRRLPAGPAAGITLVALLLVVSGALTLVGSQFSSGFSDLTSQVASGLEQIRDWVRTTFKITDSQFNGYFDELRNQVSKSGNLGDTASSIGLTATHFVAGLFIALFALFFFLYQGPRIFAWVVRLFPRVARDRVHSSGVIAWGQLSAFVRATLIVAAVDAIGIGVGAAILRVPFALPIGILVFLLAFIPIVGALLSGMVAVLLALVAHGPGVALIMLAVVIGVQQVESHVLQPFLLGKAVSVHPLAVILAIAAGSILAGIVGALVAVPFAAVLNAVGKHLLSDDSPTDITTELDEGGDSQGSPATA
ncbi:AI-2E family transporter [Humibacillus sp. DSM 29435]|uniref:AI-2E family transporter n=1 Tax=Humibacillus sp. DSM 29435 TaxID=1869167 RepID=UPI0020C7C845|nr:AI-2E family transporter [Humibacillus sp. DSM 29435]